MNQEQAIERMLKYFERTLTAKDLYALWVKDLRPHLKVYPEFDRFFNRGKQTSKKDGLSFLAKFMTHDEAMQACFKAKPEQERIAYSLLIHYGPMSQFQLNEYLRDHDLGIDSHRPLWNRFSLHNQGPRFFPLQLIIPRGDYHMDPHDPFFHQYCTIPETVQPALCHFFPKPLIELHSNQGETAQMLNLSATTSNPHQLFDTLRGFQLQGGVKYKKSEHAPTKASARNLKKRLGEHHVSLHTGLTESQDTHYEEIAILTAAKLLKKTAYTDATDFIGQLWQQLEQIGEPESTLSAEAILPHVKINPYYSMWQDAGETHDADYFSAITDFFKTLEANRLYTIRDLDCEFRKRFPSGDPTNRPWQHFYIYAHTDMGEHNISIEVEPAILCDFVIHPVIKMICCFTAVWGMAEVWFDETQHNPAGLETGKNSYLSPYDDVIAWRLNQVGAYIFGQTAKAPKLAQAKAEPTQYHLDDDHLLITRTGPPSSVDHFLAGLAEKVGDHRYLINITSFRKGCATAFDIRTRIDNFKRELKLDQVPPIWQQLFKEVQERSEPLSQIGGYVVYRVGDHAQLRELFTIDAKLRKLTLRAEQHLVLIKPSDLHTVLDVLRKNGF
jgi:hypothetical protein